MLFVFAAGVYSLQCPTAKLTERSIVVVALFPAIGTGFVLVLFTFCGQRHFCGNDAGWHRYNAIAKQHNYACHKLAAG